MQDKGQYEISSDYLTLDQLAWLFLYPYKAARNQKYSH